jgi:hypothetical protein
LKDERLDCNKTDETASMVEKKEQISATKTVLVENVGFFVP